MQEDIFMIKIAIVEDTPAEAQTLSDSVAAFFKKEGAAFECTVYGDAMSFLTGYKSVYDMVFMDANKRQYLAYYGLCLPLLRPGGLLVADDTLWDGKVYADPLPTDAQTRGLAAFNDAVAEDRRVESVILPIRDGLTIVRKK